MSRRRGGVAFSLFAFQDIITSVTGIMILVTLILAVELIQRVESTPLGRAKRVVQNMQATEAAAAQLQESVARAEARIAELQSRLQLGVSRIDEAAGLDQRAIAADAKARTQINSHIESELQKLAEDLAKVKTERQEVEEEARAHADDPERVRELTEELIRKKRELESIKQSNRVIFNPTEGDAKTPWLVEITAEAITVAETGPFTQPKHFNNLQAFQAWVGQRNKNTEYFVLLVKPSGVEAFHEIQAILDSKGFDTGADLLSADQTAMNSPLREAQP